MPTSIGTSDTYVTADGYSAPPVSASVVSAQQQVLTPPTVISTGLTNNPITDSFFLPLLLAVVGVWLYRKGFARVFAGTGLDTSNVKDYAAERKLSAEIAKIRQRENLS